MAAAGDTQTRTDPGAPLMVDGGGPLLSGWVVAERNRFSGQTLSDGEERTFSDLAQKARMKELEVWYHFRVFSPETSGAQSEDLVDTHRRLMGKNSESRIGGRRISRSGFAYGRCGKCRLRESHLLPFASDILGGPGEIAAVAPGYQECVPPGGWI